MSLHSHYTMYPNEWAYVLFMQKDKEFKFLIVELSKYVDSYLCYYSYNSGGQYKHAEVCVLLLIGDFMEIIG